MKKRLLTISLLLGILLIGAAAMPVSALSDACTALNGKTGAITTGTNEIASGVFGDGETIKVTVSGTGESFALQANGSSVGTNSMGASVVYTTADDGSFSFSVVVTGSVDGTTAYEASCAQGDPDSEKNEKVTICHIPPGNPNAAHTISVGKSALSAHLGHGDIEGECGEVESRYDDYSAGISIFTIEEDNTIEIYGDCEGSECKAISILVIADLEPIEGGEFEFDEDPDNDWVIIIYFLHLDPKDETVGVYQLNIYEDDELVNDNVLLFVGLDGDLKAWATQNIWNERADAEADD